MRIALIIAVCTFRFFAVFAVFALTNLTSQSHIEKMRDQSCTQTWRQSIAFKKNVWFTELDLWFTEKMYGLLNFNLELK